MENVKIIGCGYAYGSNCVTNDMLKNVVDTSDEWIQSRTGIKQRTVSKMKIPVIWQSELPKSNRRKSY